MITKKNYEEYLAGNKKHFAEADLRIQQLSKLEERIHKENKPSLSNAEREKLLKIHQKISGARKVLEGENSIRGLLDQNLLNNDLGAANKTLKKLNIYRQETYPTYYQKNSNVADVCIQCFSDEWFKSRKDCIIENIKTGNFIVEDNPDADDTKPLIEISGFSAVKEQSSNIDKAAQETGVDARLIRAIMYMETTHGYYDFFPALINQNKSILPMNINTDYWGDTFGSRSDLKEAYNNIKAGATILSRIKSNLATPDAIDKVATLYNNINAKKTSDYGARVKQIYDTQPWLEPSESEELSGMGSTSKVSPTLPK